MHLSAVRFPYWRIAAPVARSTHKKTLKLDIDRKFVTVEVAFSK